MFSYVRSRTTGDLNDFASYIGSFPAAYSAPESGSHLPHRFAGPFPWRGAEMKLPRGFGISPVFEYRSGFPYLVTDATQGYVGIPNSTRVTLDFLSSGRARLEGLSGQPEICGPAVRQWLQSDEPLQSRSRTRQRERPSLWPVLRRAAPALYRRLRRHLLSSCRPGGEDLSLVILAADVAASSSAIAASFVSDPRREAAPVGPEITPPDSRRARSIASRSADERACARASAVERIGTVAGQFGNSYVEASSPAVRMTERSITFCNSRMLPGQP